MDAFWPFCPARHMGDGNAAALRIGSNITFPRRRGGAGKRHARNVSCRPLGGDWQRDTAALFDRCGGRHLVVTLSAECEEQIGKEVPIAVSEG